MLEKHFVTFLSPGSFVHEETTKPILDWNVDSAIQIAYAVKERHGATPFAFRFTTRRREDNELDSKVVKESGTYYLGGEILTLAQVEERNDPDDRILIQNMKCNNWDRVIENFNSWKIVQPFGNKDIVIDFKPRKNTKNKEG